MLSIFALACIIWGLPPALANGQTFELPGTAVIATEAKPMILPAESDLTTSLTQGLHLDALVAGVEEYAIFLLDTRGNVLTWNSGAQRIKGYKAEEIIGKHFSVFYPPEARERSLPWQNLWTAANEGRSMDEGWRVRKDGTPFWASVVLMALRSEEGELRGYLKITRDLTERREFEALKRADRQKDEFIATLSHELRTHLNAIMGWVNLMRESLPDEALVSQGLEVLQRNTETVTKLTSDLVDISRIVTGTLALKFEEIDLQALVHASLETLQIQAGLKSIALKASVEIPEKIGCSVWGDEASLQRVLANILSNALKFTPERGTVTVHLMRERTTAILTIKDTGTGMAPEFVPLAFEAFSQAKRSGESHGMGLGLAICKHLVELHRGSIIIESEGPGCGTTVTVKLPLIGSRSQLSREPNPQASGEDMEMSNNRLKGIKVLAVDDDADTRNLLKIILQRSGADTTVVGSGQEALAELKGFRPHVLVCDLAMSQMDGYELLEKVRRVESRPLPSIAFTASAGEEDRIRTRRAGFETHLAKPVVVEELVATIAKLAKAEPAMDQNDCAKTLVE